VAEKGTHNLLRARRGESRVEFVELFFDLVFVFAVTRLSHRLIEHPDWRGAIETFVLLVAIWWSWINTAWVTNWLDPHRTRVRLLLFALMGAGLVASMSIPEAFGSRGAYFAIAYVAMELGRSLFTLLALRGHDPANHLNFIRIFLWQLAMAPLWIAGAWVEGDARLLFWSAAVLGWSLAPILYFPVPGLGRSRAEDWNIDPSHLAERCGLFLILALGESILVMGATFADQPWDPASLAGFGLGLAGTIAMWWLYFNIGSVRAVREFRGSSVPGRIGRLAYTYLHMPIVAGIIVAAAAEEWIVAHLHGPVSLEVALGAIGGPALFLAGTAAFKRVSGARYWPLSHLVGLGAFAALAAASIWLEPYQLGLAVVALLVATAIWETLSLRALHRAHADGGE